MVAVFFVHHLSGAAVVAAAHWASWCNPRTRKKPDAGKSAKKDKDPVNKSGAKTKKKHSKGRVWDLGSITWSCLTRTPYDKLYKEVPSHLYTSNPSCCLWESEDSTISWPGQAPSELFSRGLISCFQNMAFKVIYARNTKGSVPLLLVKMHKQIPPTAHLKNKIY